MIKPTSRAAYDALINSDRITKSQRAVLLTVACSSREVLTRRYIAHVLGQQASSISGRVNELVKAGHLAVVADPVLCPVTKRMVEGLVFAEQPVQEAARIPTHELVLSGGCEACAFREHHPGCLSAVKDAGLDENACGARVFSRWVKVQP